MLIATKLYTVHEFWTFIARPENQARHFELIGGRIIEVVSHGYPSKVVMRIGRYVDTHVDDHDLGAITGEAGGYMVDGKPYIPDIGFISKQRQPKPEYINGYNVLAPELAVEVLSPTDRLENMRIKIADYLNAGTVVWLVDPEAQTIVVYAPNKDPKTLTIEDTLDGGDVLEGFSIPVKKLFPAR